MKCSKVYNETLTEVFAIGLDDVARVSSLHLARAGFAQADALTAGALVEQ